jgi:hypothetical protein
MKNNVVVVLIMMFVFVISASAQDFGNVIQINHIQRGSQDTDGGNSIATYGAYVHILWQDMDSTFCSFVSTSSNAGASFSAPVIIADQGPHIFGALTVNGEGDVYVAWDGIEGEFIQGVYVSKSVDHAQSFASPVEVTATGAFPEILAVGNFVYVSFYAMETDSTFGFYFSRSTDGGQSFETPYMITTIGFDHFKMDSPNAMTLASNGDIYCVWNDGRGQLDATDIYMAKSTDNGASFGENIMVNSHYSGDGKLRTAPSIDIGSGNIYAVWREEADDNGNNRRILFAKSALTDLSFGPDMLIVSGGWSTPCLTTSAGGDIYLAYPQQNDINGLFCMKSSDQGASFPVTIRISPEGDYVKYPSISVDENNLLNAVWTRAEDNNEDDVLFAQGSITIAGHDPEKGLLPADFIVLQNYPNPFNPTTTINYALPENAMVSLTIYDVRGVLVRTLEMDYQSQGWHHVVWNGETETGNSPATGIYFARLDAGEYSQTIKMLMIR